MLRIKIGIIFHIHVNMFAKRTENLVAFIPSISLRIIKVAFILLLFISFYLWLHKLKNLQTVNFMREGKKNKINGKGRKNFSEDFIT